MEQPQDDPLRNQVKQLAVEIRQLFGRASEEANNCNSSLASIHPETLSPVMFSKLRNATMQLNSVYVKSLDQLATHLEDLAGGVSEEAK